jgi:hypothetical protein
MQAVMRKRGRRRAATGHESMLLPLYRATSAYPDGLLAVGFEI